VADRPGAGRWLVIDKSAASLIPHTPAAPEGLPAVDSSWAEKYADPAYAVGRPIRQVAIIGLGGGPDILPALAAGATRIDGLELNGRILEMLRSGLQGWTTVHAVQKRISCTTRPGTRCNTGWIGMTSFEPT
jgi:hypothetical protein